METAIGLLSVVFSVAGIALLVTGALGVLRLPDFYSRMHAAGITETLSALLIVSVLMLKVGWGVGFFKLLFILAFVFITSPTASHALAKAARHGRLQAHGEKHETDPS
jgi:multicomponent Na+:H+ antiporter subunit G